MRVWIDVRSVAGQCECVGVGCCRSGKGVWWESACEFAGDAGQCFLSVMWCGTAAARRAVAGVEGMEGCGWVTVV